MKKLNTDLHLIEKKSNKTLEERMKHLKESIETAKKIKKKDLKNS